MATNFKKHLTESLSSLDYSFIDESDRSEILFNYMNTQGFKLLGAGSFKAAFVNPKTHRVKIVLHDNTLAEANSLRKWVSFCMKRANNPHLPQISFSKPLIIEGEEFIAADIERLFEFSETEIKDAGMAIYDIVDACFGVDLKHSDKADAIESVKSRLNAQGIGDSMALFVLSVEDFDLLIYTLLEIISATPSNALLDLHNGNIMLASDGTIVFTDPWAT